MSVTVSGKKYDLSAVTRELICLLSQMLVWLKYKAMQSKHSGP